MNKMTAWRPGIIIALCFSMSTFATIVNRYSFTGDSAASAVDSVGGKDGILEGNASVSGNQLVLDGVDDWVSLPSDVLSNYTSASIEAWFTLNAISTWGRLFDFGETSGSSGIYYWFYAPSSGGDSRLVISAAGEQIASTTILSTATTYHIVCVYDADASQMRLYQNGSLVASTSVTMLLSDVHRVNAYIGKSNWTWDSYLNGSIDEFRIHDSAMTDAQVAVSYVAGPNTIAGSYIAPTNPSPANGSPSQATSLTLSWTSDSSPDITGHHVYLGTDYASVLNATPSSTGIYRGTTAAGITTFPVTLQIDTQYYWRVEDVVSAGYTLRSSVWAFHTYNPKAINPSPANGTAGISISGTTLSWTAGTTATSHRVYFGLSPETLQLMEDYYPSTSWPTGVLNYSKTYYWRIDERNSSGTLFTGDVWSLSTMQKPMSCIPGDLDGDCFVGIDDLQLFADQWLTNTDCDAFDCPDLDQNQYVNLSDAAILASNWQRQHDPLVVINEIHYHTDNNKQPVEFIELHNAGALQINLGGWKLEDGVSFTFPANTMLNPGDYVVVSQNPSAVTAKFGVSSYGPWTGKLSNTGEKIILRDAADNKIDEVNYDSAFPWPTAADGEGASMELLNPYLDNDLGGSWRPSGYHQDEYDLAFGAPTPGQINSVYLYTKNVPPQTRQVSHTVVTPLTTQDSEQPQSGQDVRVTVKVTDPDGVGQVNLKYQIVSPGAYIPAYLPIAPASLISDPTQRRSLNPDFENAANWTTVTMADNGSGQDTLANDDIYTAVIPGQTNRTLVRYRIEAQGPQGHSVRVPYYDDGSMNFSYFVYNGIPAWTANTDTVQAAAPYTYSAEIIKTLPTYTLITRQADIYQCNGYNASDRIDQGNTNYNLQEAGKVYNWEGTLVYDGKVYDHIDYRLRGGNGRYSNGKGGKRSMKFVFPRGNYFQARDIYGDKFPSKWQHLTTGKMIGNHYGFEGYDGYMYGMNEIMNMRLWNIVGVPAPEGLWYTFRVIDGAEEAPTATNGQYDGDFWGVYLAWEDYDGAFLERQGLPDGNLYKLSDKIYEGWRQSRFQAPDAVENTSGATGSAADYENIRWNMTASATADFVQNYMDTDEWIRYQTIKESVRHYDMFSGADCIHCLKNSAWYFYPEYTAANNYMGRLWFMPFDTDDTWGPCFNQGVDHGRAAIFDQLYITEGPPVQQTVQPAKAPIKQDYRNYLREFRDLFWQEDIIFPMIDELASHIEQLVPADRDRWRLEPGFDDFGRCDPGTLETVVAGMKSFAFQPTNIYAYWVGSSANLDSLANAEDDGTNIPNTPTITYTGTTGYPSNALTFSTTAFSDPQGNATFAASKWRIAEYEDLDTSSLPPTDEVLVDMGATWKYFKGTQEPSTTTGAWRQIGFIDTSWSSGAMPIGYPQSVVATLLSDMMQQQGQSGYYTVYLRKTFTITNPANVNSLALSVKYDDGYNVWINGTRVANYNVSGENLAYNTPASGTVAGGTGVYATNSHTLSNPSAYLVSGTNVITVQLLNVLKTSSDAVWDSSLTATYNAAAPIPQKIKKHKFEIQPVWESAEITSASQLTVQIPAGVVKPGKLYRVRSRMKDDTGRWSHWSAPVEFTTGLPLSNGTIDDVRITEVMYNPPQPNTAETNAGFADNDEFEFIEIKNFCADETRDLTYVALTSGVTFNFAGSAITSLAPGQFALVVKNAAAFNLRYPGLSGRVAGTYTGNLSNSGEQVVLTDSFNGTIADFDYNDGYGWPISADGAGHSMVPLDSALVGQPYGSLRYCGNWRASTYIKGSPAADDPAPIASVMINEIMAHTDYTNPLYPDYDSNDWIELYNPTGSSVAYNSNWYLSDNPDNLKKWPLPTTGSIAAGGRVSFDELTGFHSPITSGFGLDKIGEYVLLSYLPGNSGDRVVDYIKFGGQYNTVSTGRYPDGGTYWFFLANPGTRNTANAGPVQRPVVISEIMYHPTAGTANDEYIELYNTSTTAAVNLYNAFGTWRLDNGVSYAFPTGKSIPAGGRIVVVPFDPAVDTARLAEFNTTYACSLVAGTTIFGPWTGDLSNGGERIALQEPQEADPPQTPTTWWIISDQVIYGDYLPWPISPDGAGMALHRISVAAGTSGDNPANWTAGTPSPGN